MRSVRPLVLFALLLTVVTSGAAVVGVGSASAAGAGSGQQVRYGRFDVEIAIDAGGNFRVTETQEVVFISGSFTRASRTIGLTRVADIRDVVVSEGGTAYTSTREATRQPGSYTTRRADNALTVEWFFPATAGARRTFVLAYTVVGGLRINPDVDVLDWVALRPDLPADADAATVTVRLPADVERARLQIDSRGAGAQASVPDGRTVRFAAGAVTRGAGLEVKVAFPHGLVSAAPPQWQTEFEQSEAARQRQAAVRDLLNVILLGLGVGILVFGSLGLYFLWYLRGRDRYTGLVAEYLREPPSDLGPGPAGTLLDEQANFHDVLAAFVDLGRRGVLRITETQTPGFLGTGLGGGHDFTVELLDADAPLTDFERTLIATLFLGDETQTQLSAAKTRFTAAIPRFEEALYQEVVARGYFARSPETTRQRYRRLGTLLIVSAVAGWIVLLFAFGNTASWQIVPAIALAIIGLVLRSLARAMPVKTPKGAEEAAKWNAFRRYLGNLERYDDVADAKGIFERYLPYATAFGLEKSWVQKFATVDTPAPTWYGGGPVIIGGPGGGYYGGDGRYGGGGYYGGGGGYHGGGSSPGADAGHTTDGGGGGGWSFPTLQDVSDRGGGGLQSTSDSLMGMLDSASSVFGGGGGDSGGGWSGGGGGGDSGGGGGGGSFG